ncbi:MAG: glucosamine-6-phosphate deaminase [Verrucomicrobiota bacterium]
MSSPLRFRVFENPDSASAQVASEIAWLIRERATLGRTAVLGLATGRTPLPLYDELIYLHREEGLSFQNVVTFNLDEYLGLASDHPASMRYFMQRTFFDHVDVPPAHIHFLSGSLADGGIPAHCAAYERKITDAGGIDLQVLGIGRNGHIGFNEPGTTIDSRTRRVQLDEMTRHDAEAEFGGLANVPTQALTVGCGTILAARKIALLAWGSKKSRIVRRALERPVTPKVSASFLQTHPATQFFLDLPAASLLSRK